MIPLPSPHFFALWLVIALAALFLAAIVCAAVGAIRAQRLRDARDWMAENRARLPERRAEESALDEWLRAERAARNGEILLRAAEGASEVGGAP